MAHDPALDRQYMVPPTVTSGHLNMRKLLAMAAMMRAHSPNTNVVGNANEALLTQALQALTGSHHGRPVEQQASLSGAQLGALSQFLMTAPYASPRQAIVGNHAAAALRALYAPQGQAPGARAHSYFDQAEAIRTHA